MINDYKSVADYKNLIDYGRYCADKLLLGEKADLDAMNFYERKSFTRNIVNIPSVMSTAEKYLVAEEMHRNPSSPSKVLDSEIDAELYPFSKIDERINEYVIRLFKKHNASNQPPNKRTARAVFANAQNLLDSVIEKLALKDLFRFDAEGVRLGIKLLIERFGEKKVYDFIPAEYYSYFIDAKPNKNTPFLPKEKKLIMFDPALGYENQCKRHEMIRKSETTLLEKGIKEFSKKGESIARLNALVDHAANLLGIEKAIAYLCDYFYYVDVLYHREFERFVSTYRDYIPNDHPILWTYGGLYSNKHINIALFNKENICELPMGSKLIRKPLRGNARYLDTELVEGVNTDHFRCSLPCKKYFRDVWSKFTAYYTNRLSREYADLGSYGLAPCETLEGLTIAEARDLAPYLTDEATISALAQEFKELNPRVERTVF